MGKTFGPILWGLCTAKTSVPALQLSQKQHAWLGHCCKQWVAVCQQLEKESWHWCVRVGPGRELGVGNDTQLYMMQGYKVGQRGLDEEQCREQGGIATVVSCPPSCSIHFLVLLSLASVKSLVQVHIEAFRQQKLTPCQGNNCSLPSRRTLIAPLQDAACSPVVCLHWWAGFYRIRLFTPLLHP